MKYQGTMDIRPLTVRGTFGIAWKLVCRRAGALLGYVLLITLISALIIAVALSPILADVIKAAVSGNGFTDGVSVAVDAVISILLVGIAALVYALVITPVFNGTVYGELSSRIYADGASCGTLIKRSKYSLRRYFTIAMCLIVCSVVVNMVTSVLTSTVSGVASITGAFSAIPSIIFESSASFGALESAIEAAIGGFGGALVALIAGILLFTAAVELCAQSFLCMTYPAAVNENVKNFDAVGRSLKLASKRFGRVLACRVLFGLLRFAVYLAVAILAAIATVIITAADGSAALIAAVVALTFLLTLAVGVVFAAYSAALDTVMYFDARVRLEGNAFMLPVQSNHTQPVYDNAYSAPAQDEAQPPYTAQAPSGAEETPQYESEFIRDDMPQDNNDNNQNDGGEHGA